MERENGGTLASSRPRRADASEWVGQGSVGVSAGAKLLQRDEVVAVGARGFQELRRESRTDDVQTTVVLVGVTATVAEEPR